MLAWKDVWNPAFGLSFAANFVIAGLIVGFVATLIQSLDASGVAGFVYGIVPFSFLYLYAFTWITKGASRVPPFAWNAAVGGAFWLFFVGLTGFISFIGAQRMSAALLNVVSLLIGIGATALVTWAYLAWRPLDARPSSATTENQEP